MIKEKTRLSLVALLLAAALIFFLNKTPLTGLSEKTDIQKTLKLLSNLIELIKEDYVEEPNPSQTMDGAFRGLVNSLDVLSSYLDKRNVERYHHRLDRNLNETGIIIYKEYGMPPVIVGIKDNSPAQRNGLKIGESIGAVEDRSTMPMSMLETNLYLKNSESNPLKIKIIRMNESQEILLEKEILDQSPYSFTQDNQLAGILRIHNFHPPVVTKIKENLIPQLKSQTKPLVLDFRNCHEGDLIEAFRFINLFVQKNIIGHLEKKGDVREEVSCLEEAELEKIPLIIWTNQATIGPSEAVASVLREHRKAEVVGRKTLGLAAAQKFFLLEDGSGMVLTTAVFQPALGKKLWHTGVTPDIQIENVVDSKSYLEQTYKAISDK